MQPGSTATPPRLLSFRRIQPNRLHQCARLVVELDLVPARPQHGLATATPKSLPDELAVMQQE
jgi:hypothetical protein